MKATNLFRLIALSTAVLAISFSSCKKDNTDETSATASLEQLSTDETNVEAVTDDALKDVENVMSYHNSGYKSTDGIPCNATLDSVGVVNDTITMYITYDGLNCNGTRNRVGQVQIRKAVGTFWGMEGASVQISYINFAVTRVATGRTITLNGTKTFTNVSGGFVWQLGTTLTSVIHRVEGSMNITFDNGTTRSWNVARQRTYTGVPDALVMTIEGFGSAEGYENLVTWGTNRQSEQFYTQITTPVAHRQLCGWDPVSGTKVHQIPAMEKSAIITFGYNNNNEPISGDECPTRFRVDWTHGSISGTKYIQLP
ncbi:MAG: hypothetical protein IPH88_08230 [Bacteroidales bacterium]|nr:hypothetical protein [Bacteroidales bacterium]